LWLRPIAIRPQRVRTDNPGASAKKCLPNEKSTVDSIRDHG
jgi:hypothetical protein